MSLPTLKDFTDAVKALGFQQVRKVREYKRSGFREVLIDGWIAIPNQSKPEQTRIEVIAALQQIAPQFGIANSDVVRSVYITRGHNGHKWIDVNCLNGKVQ